MKTAKEIESEFRADLHLLMVKYNATISADDHWTSYSVCEQDIQILVEINGV
jgi:hypothetical protein